jgi:hypothetical protein
MWDNLHESARRNDESRTVSSLRILTGQEHDISAEDMKVSDQADHGYDSKPCYPVIIKGALKRNVHNRLFVFQLRKGMRRLTTCPNNWISPP